MYSTFVAFIFILSCVYTFAGAGQNGDDARTPSLYPLKNNTVQKNIFKKQSSVLTTANVAIIESRSFNSGHTMDTIWASVANNMDISTTIREQSFLDSLNMLTSTTVLIISSGTGSLTDARRDSILAFVRRGGNIYLQAEYQPSYQTNMAFGAIVDSLGGQFLYESTVAGQLVPMYISGILQSNYNQVDSLNYFWYGCNGTGDSTIVPFLAYGGNNFGFIFSSPNGQYGKMITTSDQDWINQKESIALMENILKYLLDTATAIDDGFAPTHVTSFNLKQNYPNPFNPVTRINYELKSKANVLLQVFDITGRKVRTLVNQAQAAGQYSVHFDATLLSSGIYYYTLLSSGEVQSRKMVVVK